MLDFTTETRTYIGRTGTHVFVALMGLGQRYTGMAQENGRVLVSALGRRWVAG